MRCLSFNIHTPFAGTETLSLSADEKLQAIEGIRALMRDRYPIFNLESGLDHWLSGDWKRACPQCVVVENGRHYVCGRCVEIPGLCEECGFLFAAEFSLLFGGNPRTIWQMVWTYLRYA